MARQLLKLGVAMLKLGLVSVTFRALSPREIVRACLNCQLAGIEWGADVHVPPGAIGNAREVGRWTRDAGLDIVAYGSYYRCEGGDFAPILEAALALNAPRIRVWAGSVDARAAKVEDWARIGDDLARIAAMAAREDIQIALEFHGGTLNASGASARQLLETARGAAPDLKSLWQPLRRGPNFDARIQENLDDLRAVAPFLGHVHVYQWADDASGQTRRLSLRMSAQWRAYIEALARIGEMRWLLLEFVPGDDPAILAREAAALRALIERI